MKIGLHLGVAPRLVGSATPPAMTAPAGFGGSAWSVSTGTTAAQIVLNIIAVPANGGSPITAIQYSLNGGSTWSGLVGTGTGERVLTMPAANTAYNFRIRAVNAVGNGPASAAKSATSGAGGGASLFSLDGAPFRDGFTIVSQSASAISLSGSATYNAASWDAGLPVGTLVQMQVQASQALTLSVRTGDAGVNSLYNPSRTTVYQEKTISGTPEVISFVTTDARPRFGFVTTSPGTIHISGFSAV